MDRRHVITLRFQSSMEPAEVRGDFVHFYHPQVLHKEADGYQHITLRMEPGLYQYKFRTPDGSWYLDPGNPRTRSKDGLQNSVLSVGGTREPILHAPSRPFFFLLQDGRATIRAGLRKGHGDSLRVRVLPSRSDLERADWPMRFLYEEDEHLLFEGTVPFAEKALTYLFVLESGALVGLQGSCAEALFVQRADLVLDKLWEVPSWWHEAVLYTILVDRFRKAGDPAWSARPLPPLHKTPDNPYGKEPEERFRYGGDLDGIVEALPYLSDLGVTVLHLTPIGLAPSAHRYDVRDPQVVDPTLGGKKALDRLVEAAHKRGIHLLLDLVLTHVDREFFAFREVAQKGPASPFAPWFYIQRFPFLDGPDPGYLHYQKGQWREPLLRLSEPAVIEYHRKTARKLMEHGIDGLRLDAAADVPLDALVQIAEEVRLVRRDALLLGEVIPDNLTTWTRRALHVATDFGVQGALRDYLLRKTDASRTKVLLERRRLERGGPGWVSLSFLGSHDQSRLRSSVEGNDPRVSRLGLLLLVCKEEVPALLYGEEVGLYAALPRARDFEDVWPDRLPMPWTKEALEQVLDPLTLALVKQLLKLRKSEAALRQGREECCDFPEISKHLLCIRRYVDDKREETLEVYANASDDPLCVPLSSLASDALRGATLLLSCEGATLEERQTGPFLQLPAWGGALVRRHSANLAVLERLKVEVQDHNAAFCAQAFIDGSLTTLGYPAHLYLTVTETCNLQCLHCITDAPRRTKEGTARTLGRWLFGPLRDAIRAADYIAFTHGGESLVVPIFWELLSYIKESRVGTRKPAIHLLTNGMLLGKKPQIAERLLGAGVTSVAISLDGASASTNDHIRKGANFAEILTGIRRLIEVRKAHPRDLRVGISTVLTKGNVAELPSLCKLVVELGVDWLKLEELFPVNHFSRENALPVVSLGGASMDPSLQQMLVAARSYLEAHGVVLVEHLDPPAGCPCDAQADPNLQRFRRADDYANCTTFHPCSMEWEQAFVDPDGTLRPVDSYQTPLGNLAQASFYELWNGLGAQRARAAALARGQRRDPNFDKKRRLCPRSIR